MAILLGLGVAFAMPLAGALSFGVDAHSVPEMKNAGATPTYGQTWVGAWMRSSGWSGYESDMRTMRDNGVVPVVQWYYWGDRISVNCVQYGCNGNTKGNWDSMAKEMAVRGNAIMGHRPFLVVLEPEFNKNGISDWETFDAYLENQARIVKANAPNAKVVVGFGYWGGWDRFDRAMDQADYSGFQILRGSTRDSSSIAIGAADQMIDVGKTLKGRFGKDVVVFDLGIATYGGWEWVQEASLKRVIEKRAALDSAGVKVIVWRYLYDNDYSSGYFGPAESSWGVKYSWGGKKSGYDELVTLLKGSTSAPTPAPTTTTTAPSTTGGASPSPSDTFTDVKGNEWWVQANVAGSPAKVEARVNGGAWNLLQQQNWGAWAKSIHAPTGSTVELRATWSSGGATSASYRWPDATPVGSSSTGSPSTTPTTTSGSGFDATYANVMVKDWWVQTDVKANQGVSAVAARVNGGTWISLQKQSWGAWAKSFHVPSGAKVEFRATSTGGAQDHSGAYYA